MDCYRCLHCKTRVANLVCLSCSDGANKASLCYECDQVLHPDVQHRKQLLNDLSSKKCSFNNTPLKRMSSVRQTEQFNSPKSETATMKVSRYSEGMLLKKNYEVELMQLKYEKMLEDKDSQIVCLQSQLQQEQSKHSEQLSKMRDYLIAQEEDLKHESQSELQKMKAINSERVSAYQAQIEEQKLCIKQLESNIENQRHQYENQISELSQELFEMHQKLSSKIMTEKKVEDEVNQAVTRVSQKWSVQNQEHQLINSEMLIELDQFNHENDRLKRELELRSKEHQQKQLAIEYELKEHDLLIVTQQHEKEALLVEIKNLQKEIRILEKENELFQQDKVLSMQKLEDQKSLINKLERIAKGKSIEAPKCKVQRKVQK